MPAHHLGHVDKHLGTGHRGHGWATPRAVPPLPLGHWRTSSRLLAPGPSYLSPTRHLLVYPLPPTPQSCSRSQNPGPELKGTPGLTGRAGTGFSPKSSCVLTSRYSRSVSFSSWKAVRIWNQGEQGGRGSVKAKRHWEDPGEAGPPRQTVGLRRCEGPAPGTPAACRAGLARPKGWRAGRGTVHRPSAAPGASDPPLGPSH